jgi:hypothetical protein
MLWRPQADWSKLYILNIMDIKTTMECGEGIKVEIKYPPCIMENDRVRLYGKLPANVHSIAKPTRFVKFSFPFDSAFPNLANSG